MKEIKFFQTQELIDELFCRFDNACFVFSTNRGKDSDSDFGYTRKGNLHTIIGLLETSKNTYINNCISNTKSKNTIIEDNDIWGLKMITKKDSIIF